MLPAGSTIGILGGGQLGRMMAMAALQLGYRCIAYAPPGDNVAEDACADFFESGWSDREALAAFAAKCDVVTWEFENVPLGAVAAIPPALLACPARALEVAQDRLNEKSFIAELGGTSAPYARVESDEDFARALVSVGTPGILKTAREGYDGKGQWRIASAHEATGVRFPGRPCIYEGLVAFENEFSVILVRSASGEVRFWDSTANHHEGGMLAQSVLPASALIEAQVPGGARACREDRAGPGLCRGADARILRDQGRPGVQRNGAARPQFGPLDHRRRGHQPVRKPHPRHHRPAAGGYRDPLCQHRHAQYRRRCGAHRA
jgi:5-(carboxyamino)imidazole ribonucleotide synthase